MRLRCAFQHPTFQHAHIPTSRFANTARALRGDWGFDGYITSDCDADSDVFYSHHYTKTPEEAVRDVLRAGTDVDCGGFVTLFAKSALDKGLITEADLDARLYNLFKVRMRLSHFDPIGPLDKIPTSTICSAAGQALARDGVTQSVVLLKNAHSTLPFRSASAKYAVIGPNAMLSKAIAGYYGPSNVCNGTFSTVVDALQQHASWVQYAPGTPSVLSNDLRCEVISDGVWLLTNPSRSEIPTAVALAKIVDYTVLVVGTDLSWCGKCRFPLLICAHC
jgi:beta-glucosidase-like glycosyl hydrolase